MTDQMNAQAQNINTQENSLAVEELETRLENNTALNGEDLTDIFRALDNTRIELLASKGMENKGQVLDSYINMVNNSADAFDFYTTQNDEGQRAINDLENIHNNDIANLQETTGQLENVMARLQEIGNNFSRQKTEIINNTNIDYKIRYQQILDIEQQENKQYAELLTYFPEGIRESFTVFKNQFDALRDKKEEILNLTNSIDDNDKIIDNTDISEAERNQAREANRQLIQNRNALQREEQTLTSNYNAACQQLGDKLVEHGIRRINVNTFIPIFMQNANRIESIEAPTSYNFFISAISKEFINVNNERIQQIQQEKLEPLNVLKQRFYNENNRVTSDQIAYINNNILNQERLQARYNAQRTRIENNERQQQEISKRSSYMPKLLTGIIGDKRRLDSLQNEATKLDNSNIRISEQVQQLKETMARSPDQQIIYSKVQYLRQYNPNFVLTEDLANRPYNEVNNILNHQIVDQYIKNNEALLERGGLNEMQKQVLTQAISTLKEKQSKVSEQSQTIQTAKVQQQQTEQKIEQQQTVQQAVQQQAEQKVENKQSIEKNDQNIQKPAVSQTINNTVEPQKQPVQTVQKQEEKQQVAQKTTQKSMQQGNSYNLKLKDNVAKEKSGVIVKKDVPSYKPDNDFKLIDTYFSATVNDKEVPFSGFVLTLMNDKSLTNKKKQELVNNMLSNIDNELKNKAMSEEERKKINQAREDIGTYLNNSISVFKKHGVENKCIEDIKCDTVETIHEISDLVKDNKKLHNKLENQIQEVHKQEQMATKNLKQQEQRSMEKLFIDLQANNSIPNCGTMFVHDLKTKQFTLSSNFEQEKQRTEQALYDTMSPKYTEILKQTKGNNDVLKVAEQIRSDLSDKYKDTFKQDAKNPLTLGEAHRKTVALSNEINALTESDKKGEDKKVQKEIEAKKQELEAAQALYDSKALASIKTIKVFEECINKSGTLEKHREAHKQIETQEKQEQGHTRENSRPEFVQRINEGLKQEQEQQVNNSKQKTHKKEKNGLQR